MINAIALRSVEVFLSIGFLLLSLLVFSLALAAVDIPTWVPEAVSDFSANAWLVAVLAGLAGYWGLRILASPIWAFGALAVTGITLQLPAVISYSRLDWLFFFADIRWFQLPTSSLEVGALFLLSLAILVLLYRTILLGDQERTVRRQGVDALEYRQVMLQQYLFTIGLVLGSLLLAAGLVLVSSALGGIGGLLERWPWTVLTVGGLATLIISATLLYWMRSSEAG